MPAAGSWTSAMYKEYKQVELNLQSTALQLYTWVAHPFCQRGQVGLATIPRTKGPGSGQATKKLWKTTKIIDPQNKGWKKHHSKCKEPQVQRLRYKHASKWRKSISQNYSWEHLPKVWSASKNQHCFFNFYQTSFIWGGAHFNCALSLKNLSPPRELVAILLPSRVYTIHHSCSNLYVYMQHMVFIAHGRCFISNTHNVHVGNA